RAAAGVTVRLIVDAVGSRSMLAEAKRQLGPPGAEVRAFMPLRHSPIRGRTNLRSHRKLAVVDGERVFGGGMNLAEESMGAGVRPLGDPRWRDASALVSGPVARDAAALFESDWRYCGGRLRVPEVPAPAERGSELVQLVPSGPDMATDTVYDAFLTGIFSARERVVLVTPYYVPDEALQHALVLSARRGVRTEVVVPLRSNHRVADVARRALLRELRAAGVRVHYYPHGMVHAKALAIDGSVAYVGSPNFDMRSLFLNYEVAFFVYSKDAVAGILGFIDELVAESVASGPRQRENWLVERIARLLAPEL
ncbi:MAG TPA: phospholipase D-like domain-containing protein, partial [Polyangiaceae bacterium]|nr:phospholipase D-like domain-containing protein [Polyangiaceae bacterium]